MKKCEIIIQDVDCDYRCNQKMVAVADLDDGAFGVCKEHAEAFADCIREA